MALMRIKLSFAARHVVNNIFTDMFDVDLTVARNVREIRRRFELTEVVREVEHLKEEAKRVEDARQRAEEVARKGGNPDPAPEGHDNYGWEELLLYEEETQKDIRAFTLDEGYLKFLQDLVSKKKWNKFNVLNPQTGELKEITVGLSPGNMEAIADLADALHAAEPVKPEEK